MTPAVTDGEPWGPAGAPTTMAVCPTLKPRAEPRTAGSITLLLALSATASTARSLSGSAPAACAGHDWPSAQVTSIEVAPSTRWKFVSTCPSERNTTPEPNRSPVGVVARRATMAGATAAASWEMPSGAARS